MSQVAIDGRDGSVGQTLEVPGHFHLCVAALTHGTRRQRALFHKHSVRPDASTRCTVTRQGESALLIRNSLCNHLRPKSREHRNEPDSHGRQGLPIDIDRAACLHDRRWLGLSTAHGAEHHQRHDHSHDKPASHRCGITARCQCVFRRWAGGRARTSGDRTCFQASRTEPNRRETPWSSLPNDRCRTH